MLYPLFFAPIYKSTIWGGRNFETLFNRNLPDGKIAESWDVSCHGKDISIVSNGNLKGRTIKSLMEEYKNQLLGSKCDGMNFPLLIKLIDANDKLSVQVHPDDEYAKLVEGDMGKTEMWYIIKAKPGAQLIYGTKPGTTAMEFKKAIEDSNLNSYLNYVNVKEGDVVYIPSGTVHAILDGIVIAEIQQNSATTYRVYDWGRVDKSGNPRELHVKKALDVINFDFKGKVNNTEMLSYDGYMIGNVVKSPYFTVDKINVSSKYMDKTDRSTLHIFTCLKGIGKLYSKDFMENITAGSSFLIPASLGEFHIEGSCELLKSYIV